MAKKQLKPMRSAQEIQPQDPAAKLFLEAVIDAAAANNQLDINQDYIFLAVLATQYQVLEAAMKDIEAYGINLTTTGDKGQDRVTKNPSVSTAADASKTILNGLKEMGLTPKSRAQMNLIKQETDKVNPILAALQARDDDE
ncbi:P27 family phage terminase small subunit [Aeromonas sobria]|uniref:P27 family phage terminase small subunit n=1 Tax=Aeromonas sobria TaxID=646 RepID=UPI000C6CA6AC|nr:P27 family phage terminase small subunit [Aeromonas sobria]PKQ78080.1 hypothetical protein CJF47_07310 [Aeromonas sobria]